MRLKAMIENAAHRSTVERNSSQDEERFLSIIPAFVDEPLKVGHYCRSKWDEVGRANAATR